MRRRATWRRVLALTSLVLFGAAIWRPQHARANVQEQRQRLPPPAFCTDPVAGIWMSHKFSPEYADWYIFTLKIERKPGSTTELVGEIESHSWSGSATDEEPPPCRIGLDHWTVLMTAKGHAKPDGNILFGGTSWRPVQAYCGQSPGRGQYNLDNFSGIIDPKIQEFQSVNNDGGRMVNDPMVFRRVRCLDPSPRAQKEVKPPPFYSKSKGGCSWF